MAKSDGSGEARADEGKGRAEEGRTSAPEPHALARRVGARAACRAQPGSRPDDRPPGRCTRRPHRLGEPWASRGAAGVAHASSFRRRARAPQALADGGRRRGAAHRRHSERRAAAEHRGRIPHEGERIRVGDPDDDSLRNEYVGEETPGGSTPTPDQSDVDEIGLAYGVQDEDSGELRTSCEVLDAPRPPSARYRARSAGKL